MPRRSKGGVLVRRRRRGIYYAIRFRALGKRRYVTLGSSRDGWDRRRAEEELANVLADVRRGIWVPPRREPPPAQEPPPEPSFHEFASEWFESHVPEWRESTRLDYRWQLELHLLPFFARHRLSEITVEEVDRYRAAKVSAGGLSATSINKTLTRLAQILEVAVEYGHIERNPARGKRRRVRASAPRRSWLDRADQIESLLDAAGELDAKGRGARLRRPLLTTLTFAGLRLGEALALRWRDVDLAGGRLRVGSSKTDAGVRYVELLAPLRDELGAYKAGAGRSGADDLVFATATDRPISQSNVRNRVLAGAVRTANERRHQAELAGLPEGLTPHSLRRTFISLLLAIGEEVPFVMQQAGHADPKVTLGIYAQVMFRRDGERDRLRDLVHGGADAVVDLSPENADGHRASPESHKGTPRRTRPVSEHRP